MTLTSVIRELDSYEEDAFVCLMKPWVPDSACKVVSLDDSFAVVGEAKEMGFDFFLEVGEIRTILQSSPSGSDEEKAALVIRFAQDDDMPNQA